MIATERGLLRLDGTTFSGCRARAAPGGATDPGSLPSSIEARSTSRPGTTTSWPTGLSVEIAAAVDGDGLVAVGATCAGLELVTLAASKLARDPIANTPEPSRWGGARQGRSGHRRPRRWAPGPTRPGTLTTITVREALPGPAGSGPGDLP
ncbi:MAG: hypothetical protein IPQ07_33050 [Myxococcales bacterium]|nr:hypothetical protein [Myxococcales bacterium]